MEFQKNLNHHFEAKNGNFKSYDFSSLIEWILASMYAFFMVNCIENIDMLKMYQLHKQFKKNILFYDITLTQSQVNVKYIEICIGTYKIR